MKERTFYTINLDSKRIAVLLGILLVVLVYSFLLGYTLGKKKGQRETGGTGTADELSFREKESKTGKFPDETKKEKEKDELTEDSEDSIKSEIVELKPAKENEKKEASPKESSKTKSSSSKEVVTEKLTLEYPMYYSIQLGSFSTKSQARKFRKELIANNKIYTRFKPYIIKNGNLYSVRMGRATIKEDLDKILLKLEPDLQKTAIIVKNQN
ncbi:MAG: SPOR domain-containing protein [Leptospiraceae bacterium]|nr:SPOR domain-containing protein [Leptospiraceae bacterium]MCP5511309.1 SPOR domain-containing protein [Leptospiraceae bacterium]